MSVLYHPDKTNVVADALSFITTGGVSHNDETKKDLVMEFHWFSRMGVSFEGSPIGGAMVHHNFES